MGLCIGTLATGEAIVSGESTSYIYEAPFMRGQLYLHMSHMIVG